MKKTFKEFRGFVSESNFIEVGVGLLIAGAIGELTKTVTGTLIDPIINKFLQLIHLSGNTGTFNVLGMRFKLGDFFIGILNFAIVLIFSFFIIKAYLKLKIEAEETKIEEVNKTDALLEEIRDLLKENQLKEKNEKNN